MKPYSLIVLTAMSFLLVTSCRKIDTPNEEAKALFGEWEFQGDTGGFSGSGGSNRFNQNTTIKFTEKGAFFIYENGKKKDKKKFKIEMKESISSAQSELAIVYSSNNYEIFRIINETLILSDNIYDGYSYSFIRK